MADIVDYLSTRDGDEHQTFAHLLTHALARNGGLYVPAAWPSFAPTVFARWVDAPYQAVATEVLRPFIGDAFTGARLAALIEESYRSFRHLAPLDQIDDHTWLLDLTGGPTLAFKDYPLQVLAPMTQAALAGRPATILTATSGDTGAAAVAAFADRPGIRVIVLFPDNRIAEIQRLQMTTTGAANVQVCAVDGTFDDCQALVKGLFAEQDTARRANLMAVNSINFARIAIQTVYYAVAAVKIYQKTGTPPAFIVPTGNFGNIYAGYGARLMGLPIGPLVIANNRNDAITRFLSSGALVSRPVVATTSPAMDIQIPSNFERYLFDLLGHGRLKAFLADPTTPIDASALAAAQEHFSAHAVDDAQASQALAALAQKTGHMVCPHTATALVAATKAAAQNPAFRTTPRIIIATAHPAKFPDTVQAATAQAPSFPKGVPTPDPAKERVTSLPASLDALRAML
ncbi:MAG: threonine synthase [Pseudomonadota bacterium]